MIKKNIKQGERIESFTDWQERDVKVGDFILTTKGNYKSRSDLQYGMVMQINFIEAEPPRRYRDELRIRIAGVSMQHFHDRDPEWELNYTESILQSNDGITLAPFIESKPRRMLMEHWNETIDIKA